MTICVYTALADVPGEVRGQLSYPAEPNFFLSFDWFELLFETSLKDAHSPRIYVFLSAEGRVLCSLFCCVPVGSERSLLSLTNFYSVQYLPGLAQSGLDQTPLRSLIRHIASERPRWHTLRFSMLSEGGVTAQVVDALEGDGWQNQRYFQYENWYAPVSGETFESYFAQRPSQLRNTVIRKQKKLEKSSQIEIQIGRTESPDLARLVRDFTVVYGGSWKQPEPHPHFIPALASRCAELGILRLGVLYIDGQAAAAQLWITAGKRAVIYKLAYDEKFGQLGVGSILSRELFRVALDEDHVDEIDYGVGSEPYKKDWMTAVRQIRGLESHNLKTPKGLLLAGWAETKTLVKKWRPNQKAAQTGVAT
jgi:Acetyltransferase (GNAT) domain